MAGNSWQQPVAGEPSWGSPHEHLYDTGSSDPADANVHSLDLSAQVPVGTMGVEGFISMASGTVGDYVIVTNAAGTATYGIARADAASATTDGWFKTPLTSARLMYYMASNSRITAQRFRIVNYFI
jgi:hypothetical protein